jgi:hypothetical protein
MATITVTPNPAVKGTTVDIDGSGFDPKIKFALTTVDVTGVEVGQATNTNRPRRDGTFKVGINVPPLVGASKVRAYQNCIKVAEAEVSVVDVSTPPQPPVGGTRNFYIAPTGNDTTGNGSIGSPWASISKFIALPPIPGDTLYCRGGTYTASGNRGQYIWGISGTASMPITIRNYVGETPIFDGQNSGSHFIISSNSNTSGDRRGGTGTRYWIFDGLKILNYAPTSSAILVNGNWTDADSVVQGNWIVRNCHIKLVVNSNGISTHGFYIGGGSANNLVEDNIFEGPYIQGVNQVTGAGIHQYHWPSGAGNIIRRNVIKGWEEGIQLWDEQTPRTLSGSFLHNTFINCANNIDARYHGSITIRDNAGETGDNANIVDSNASYTTADHNFWGQTFDSNYKLVAGSSGIKAASDGTDAGAIQSSIQPSGTVSRLTSSDTKAAFLAQTTNMAIDVIELAGGTYTWQDVQINVDRTARPLTIRPVAGATVNFVGPATSSGQIFGLGSSTLTKYITFDGSPGAMVFKDFALASSGVFEPMGTDHCTFKYLTFQNLSRDRAWAPQPYHSWCFYISGAGSGGNDHLLIDHCTFKAPAYNRDISCMQVASSGTHGAITITNVLEMTGYDYGFYAEQPTSSLILDMWTMNNVGNLGTSIRFTAANINGSYSNIHATNSDKLLNQSTGTITNGGGNSGI